MDSAQGRDQKAIRKPVRRLSLTWQRVYPIVTGLIVGLFYIVWAMRKGDRKLADWGHDFLSHMVDVSGVLVGFTFAVKGIILSIDSRRSIRYLKEAGVYNNLIDYMHSVGVYGLFLIVISATGMICQLGQFEVHRWVYRPWTALWLTVATALFFSTYRALKVFKAVMRFPERVDDSGGVTDVDLEKKASSSAEAQPAPPTVTQ